MGKMVSVGGLGLGLPLGEAMGPCGGRCSKASGERQASWGMLCVRCEEQALAGLYVGRARIPPLAPVHQLPAAVPL